MRRMTALVGRSPLPDRWAIPLQYYLETGRWPDLHTPRTFNEHLMRLKLGADGAMLAKYVDKLAARRVAAAALGPDCLVPLVGGPWRRGKDVPVMDLPPCALKCTHASHAGLRIAGPLGDGWSLHGGHQVCALQDVGAVVDRWLGRDWYHVARERPYHYVTPRVFAEAWIDGAMDYKVMVFGGVPRVIQRHGVDEDGATIDLYDVNGFALRAGKAGFSRFGATQLDFDLASRLGIAAGKVAAEISPVQDYVRVDFLVAPEGRIYFGEITFYDSGGLRPFEPTQVNFDLGRWFS